MGRYMRVARLELHFLAEITSLRSLHLIGLLLTSIGRNLDAMR